MRFWSRPFLRSQDFSLPPRGYFRLLWLERDWGRDRDMVGLSLFSKLEKVADFLIFFESNFLLSFSSKKTGPEFFFLSLKSRYWPHIFSSPQFYLLAPRQCQHPHPGSSFSGMMIILWWQYMTPYLIFVTNAANVERVKFSVECKKKTQKNERITVLSSIYIITVITWMYYFTLCVQFCIWWVDTYTCNGTSCV